VLRKCTGVRCLRFRTEGKVELKTGNKDNPYALQHFKSDPANRTVTCPRGVQLDHTGHTTMGGVQVERLRCHCKVNRSTTRLGMLQALCSKWIRKDGCVLLRSNERHFSLSSTEAACRGRSSP